MADSREFYKIKEGNARVLGDPNPPPLTVKVVATTPKPWMQVEFTGAEL
jgi:hypothetical protein